MIFLKFFHTKTTAKSSAGHATTGNRVRVLSPNHPQAYEAGGTLLKIGSKYKNIRFDVGSNSLFHMNIQLAKTANYHLSIGMLGAGLRGGIACDYCRAKKSRGCC